ncbi:hypothetical protein HKD37_06G016744 [Glycine soja]
MLIVHDDKILAQMKNVDVQMENVNFQVGQTYVILNFEVEKNSGQYKATHHAFKINFVKEPKIMPHEILGTMYNFTMFDNIVNGSTTLDYVTEDVIGEVVEIGTYPIAIHNSTYGSQRFVNNDMKETMEFKDQLATSY